MAHHLITPVSAYSNALRTSFYKIGLIIVLILVLLLIEPQFNMAINIVNGHAIISLTIITLALVSAMSIAVFLISEAEISLISSVFILQANLEALYSTCF